MRQYHEVMLSASAARSVRSIHATDPVTAKAIIDTLEFISSDVEFGDSRTIADEPQLRRINIDDYFALYWIRREGMTVIVLSISRRRGR